MLNFEVAFLQYSKFKFIIRLFCPKSLRAPRWGADVFFLLLPGRRTFARGYDDCTHSGGYTRNAIAY
jgi:hypothetical protein